jgi:hypothetical protein
LAWSFQDGLARVAFYEGIGYIDKQARVVIPPRFLDNRDFSEGLARVQIR